MRALDIDGRTFELEADGMQAVCIQHEMDHLKGKVFVEYLSRLKRSRILARMRKLERRVRLIAGRRAPNRGHALDFCRHAGVCGDAAGRACRPPGITLVLVLTQPDRACRSRVTSINQSGQASSDRGWDWTFCSRHH